MVSVHRCAGCRLPIPPDHPQIATADVDIDERGAPYSLAPRRYHLRGDTEEMSCDTASALRREPERRVWHLEYANKMRVRRGMAPISMADVERMISHALGDAE